MSQALTSSTKIATPDEIGKMRVAGRLAADVLDFIAHHVKPGTKLVLPMDAPLKGSPEEGYQGDVLTRKPGGDLR